MRQNFVLDEKEMERFCLCELGEDTGILETVFKRTTYIPVSYRDNAWKILKIDETLSLTKIDPEERKKHMENLKVNRIWNWDEKEELFQILRIAHKEVLKFSKDNFSPTLLYLKFADDDGMVKKQIRKILSEIKIHSYTSCLSPATSKFSLSGNFSFEEFLEKIRPYNLDIPTECWDYHCQRPYFICDE